MKKGFFIGELSRRVGIPPHTIRYYERLGLINPPERSETHYRVYSQDDEVRLRFIKQAKLFGLSLDEIKEIIGLRAGGVAPCEHLKRLIKRHLDDLDQHIRELVAFRNELARRYEKLTSTQDIPAGTICGFIEREELPLEEAND
ncbi:Mercuric resistance operon regulatory protein [Neomoorella carbonis]